MKGDMLKTPLITPSSLAEKHHGKDPGQRAREIIDAYLPRESVSNKYKYATRDIFRQHFDNYIKEDPVSSHTEKIIRTMMACGTGELGYSLYICEECGEIQVSPDKCGCRYCSSCGYLRKLRWIEERKSEIIEGIPYYHVVFTVPHELNTLIFQNPKALLDNLFSSAAHTVLELCAEKKKFTPGIVMILHTFSSNMLLHYHIHMLVSGGGLSLDKNGFVPLRSKKYFLPAKVVAKRYRSLFMKGMESLHDSDGLQYFGDALKYRNSYEWKELLDACYAKDWNVEIKYLSSFSPDSHQANPAEVFSRYADRTAISGKKPVRHGDSEEVSDVIQYFSEYSGRSAITDNRIRSVGDKTVSFEYKDYRSGGRKKTMTVSVREFMRRFMLHILPANVSKIRYAGFLAGRVKKKNLELIRDLLHKDAPQNPVAGMRASEMLEFFFGTDISICPVCEAKLKNAGHRMTAEATADQIGCFKSDFDARAS